MGYDFEWIGGSRRTGDILVSMNPKLGRIVIYQGAFNLIKEKTGQEPKFVRLGITGQHPDAFWIKPCGGLEEGALKIHAMGNTRMISAKALFNALTERGWYSPGQRHRTRQFLVDWDEGNEALKVELKQEANPQE